MLRVEEALSAQLLREPESGMGFQRVSVTDPPGSNEPLNWVILNAEIACAASGDWLLLPQELELLDGIAAMIARLWDQGDDARRRAVLPVPDDVFPYSFDQLSVLTGDSYSAQTRENEVFCRYSAFLNDRRVDLGRRCFLPGTYVATAHDAEFVSTGLAAVARYALPNPAPAVYTYKAVASAGVPITCGTVAPAFGQAGGGIEVQLGGRVTVAEGRGGIHQSMISDR